MQCNTPVQRGKLRVHLSSGAEVGEDRGLLHAGHLQADATALHGSNRVLQISFEYFRVPCLEEGRGKELGPRLFAGVSCETLCYKEKGFTAQRIPMGTSFDGTRHWRG